MPHITANPPALEALFYEPNTATVVELVAVSHHFRVTHKWRKASDEANVWQITTSRHFESLPLAQRHWAKLLLAQIETNLQEPTV